MERRILFEAIKDGVSILTCKKLKKYIYIENDCGESWRNILAKHSQMEDGTEYLVVKYSKKRDRKIEKDEFSIPGERMEFATRDRAKHLRRLAIVKKVGKSYRIVQDDLLYVSVCAGGMAIGCNVNGDVLLLNERGQIVCSLGKRRQLMKVVDPKTGKTYRQLAKEHAKKIPKA